MLSSCRCWSQSQGFIFIWFPDLVCFTSGAATGSRCFRWTSRICSVNIWAATCWWIIIGHSFWSRLLERDWNILINNKDNWKQQDVNLSIKFSDVFFPWNNQHTVLCQFSEVLLKAFFIWSHSWKCSILDFIIIKLGNIFNLCAKKVFHIFHSLLMWSADGRTGLTARCFHLF